MEFYKILSKAYDEVFPFSEDTFAFLKSYADGAALDIGCATGAYVKRFHEEGFDAAGIEYVPELIKYQKDISVGDMRKLPAALNGRFSLVYCIGNTLAHCTDTKDAENILTGFAKTLKKGGRCIIQILNYDKILKNRPSELPLIQTDTVSFIREYGYTDHAVTFKGTLNAGGESSSSAVQLYPLTLSELKAAAEKAGFTKAEVYGSFTKEPYDEKSSFPLIAVFGLP